jgi:hypothetical protein
MVFEVELLVGFSRGRDFEIFYECGARNKKSKVVTDTPTHKIEAGD